MNNNKTTNKIIGGILLVSLAVTLFYYPRVPDIIPTHWGISGRIDATGPKYMLFVFWGLALFVGIPLPGTGAWTGSLIAALLEIDIKKAVVSELIGIAMATVIMSIVSYGLLGAIL